MKNINPYPSYKPSGIAWLGDIPLHWEQKRLKYVFKIEKRIAGELGHDVLSITQNGIKIKDIKSGEGQLSMDYSKYQLVYKGDFAMNHMDLLTGYVDISDYDGVISPDYRAFTMLDSICFDKYLLRLLQLGYRKRIFYALGQGVSLFGRWRLSAESFNNFIFPIPPVEEQTAIAHFLDYKLHKIDRFIRKKKKLIGLLNEQKAAIINDAVTKGLDPTVKMKGSGIEWLGDVPKHWEVKKLKHVLYLQRGHDLSKEQFIEGEVPVFGSNGIIGYHNKMTTKAPCITVGRSGSVGKVNFVNDDFWAHNTCLFVKESFGNDWLYLFHLLKTIDITMVSNGSAVPTLDRKNVHNLFIAYPPKNEQPKIVEYIEKETALLTQTIHTIEKEIALVQEYRTTLIAEAVTGKIDVRQFTMDSGQWTIEEDEAETEVEMGLDTEY